MRSWVVGVVEEEVVVVMVDVYILGRGELIRCYVAVIIGDVGLDLFGGAGESGRQAGKLGW